MKDDPKQKNPQLFAISFVTRTLLLCVIPSVAFALIGRWIDKHWNLSWPIATICGLFLALFVVYRLVVREAARYHTFFS